MFAMLVLALAPSAHAQMDKKKIPFGDLGAKRSSATAPAIQKKNVLELSANFSLPADSREGKLNLTANIGAPWHIFSLNQSTPGPRPSRIDFEPSDDFELTGPFQASVDPHVGRDDAFPGVAIEEHEGKVTFSAPIRFAEGVDVTTKSIELIFSGQRCLPKSQGGTCIAINNKKVLANYVAQIATNSKSVQLKGTHLRFTGSVSRHGGDGPIEPGDTVTVSLSGEPVDGYYVYELEDKPREEIGSRPTLIALTRTNGWDVHAPVPVDQPKLKEGDPAKDSPPRMHHDSPVTWDIDIVIPKDAVTEDTEIAGVIGFQTCTSETCDRPTAITWTATIPVGQPVDSTNENVLFGDEVPYTDAEDAVKKFNSNIATREGEWSGSTLISVLPLAFLAGFILNFMPCVLPVIGLKIMSFVNQAGQNPRRVFMLNLVFVLGMLSVFMLLATLAVVSGFGWGDLYRNLPFKVTMIGVIFVFGLSFFDVWEIPIPGLVSSGGYDQRDGMSGQFFKGIITTLLATPCSGPLLIPAVVWAMAQPAHVTYLVFLFLGLGMAIPYLVIGAFPSLASFLPKPGKWTETFKQAMGFVMMGTVVFFIGAVNSKYTISVLTMLVIMGVACWYVGRIPLSASTTARTRGWIGGLVMTVLGILFAFFVLLPLHELDYQRYSRVALDQNLSEGRTVLVDFTADW